MDKVRVLIVDDSAVMRKIIASALQKEPSIEIAGFAANINVQTNATYTLTGSDNGKIITFSNACTVTVPNTLFAGFNCFLLQAGAGQVTIVGAGVTVNNRTAYNKTAGTYAIATILGLNATTFISSGDMSN